MLPETPQDRLVRSAQAGDPTAIERLFAQYRPLVLSIGFRYRHLALVEDLEGECYLAFARLIREYDSSRGIPLPHYIARSLTLAIHTFVRRECRVRARHVTLHEQVIERGAPDPGEGKRLLADDREAHAPGHDPLPGNILFWDSLKRLLERLSPRQAYVFMQRALLQQEYTCIATTLGSSPGAIRDTYYRARQRLREDWPEFFAAAD